MNIIFLGPPGCGKGTQAKELVEKHQFRHFSTGDIFRDAVASGSELGKKLKNYLESGQLVPDEMVSDVIFETLRKQKSKEKILLDGYPRTVGQAEALERFSDKEGMKWDMVLFFDMAHKKLIERLSARRQCPVCKSVYNLVSNPPKSDNVCDKDGTALIQRPDDQTDVVKNRLLVYQTQTRPVLDFYGRKAGFRKIDADQPIPAVTKGIVSSMENMVRS